MSDRHGPESSPPGDWLERRLSDVPPELADAVRGLAEFRTGSGFAAAASRAALAALDRAGRERTADSEAREAALRLLAADALLTYAFEAAADGELGGSAAAAEALAVRVGPRGELGGRTASPET